MSAPDPAEAPSLRDFAVATYGGDGVQAACLTLQDAHGLDVNVVLFAGWAGAVAGRALGPQDVAAASEAVRRWREEVVRPLRSVRRALKSMEPLADARAALRARVKAAELEAELLQLDALEGLAAELGRPSAPCAALVDSNLSAVVDGLPADAQDAVAAIAAACHSGSTA